MQDDLDPKVDDTLCDFHRPVRCAAARTPCYADGDRRLKRRGSEALDTVQEVCDTRSSSRRKELERVEGAWLCSALYELCEMRHGGVKVTDEL